MAVWAIGRAGIAVALLCSGALFAQSPAAAVTGPQATTAATRTLSGLAPEANTASGFSPVARSVSPAEVR